MFETHPEPSEHVAPSIESLVTELNRYHNELAGEAASLNIGTSLSDVESVVGQAALTTRIMGVIATRLDPDVSDKLHELAICMESDRRHLAFDAELERNGRLVAVSVGPDTARSKLTTAMALSEGLMVTTMIDGPARGSSTVNVVAHAQAEATAIATASAVSMIDRLAVLSGLVGYSADGWAGDGGVVAVMVVGVEPVGKCGGAFGF